MEGRVLGIQNHASQLLESRRTKLRFIREGWPILTNEKEHNRASNTFLWRYGARLLRWAEDADAADHEAATSSRREYTHEHFQSGLLV